MEESYGTWKLDHSKCKNMPEFLKAAGFPEAMCTEFMARDYTCTYSGDATKLCTKVKVENRPNLPERLYEFPFGKEVEILGVDGESTLATVIWDGSKFCETFKAKDGSYEFVMTRETKGNEMEFISKLKGKDVELFEIYNRC